jgi:predicted kinase
MEMILLVGIQGSGKTTFFRERFFDTHVRVSLDMLRTRERERILIAACLMAQQPLVIDNTNTLASERAGYLAMAQQAGFRTIVYFFKTELRAAIARSNSRKDRKIPVPAILRSYKRLEPPSKEEGFSELYTVAIDKENKFLIESYA